MSAVGVSMRPDYWLRHQFATQQANWLPAPEGPFYMVMRIYWPEQAALDGTWTPPSVVRKV